MTSHQKKAVVAELPTVDASTCTDHQFFDTFITTRTPCLIRAHHSSVAKLNALLELSSLYTNTYLMSRAGHCLVQVEQRRKDQRGNRSDSGNSDGFTHERNLQAPLSFGHGIKVNLLFRDFLSRLQQHDDSLYLTTQTSPCTGSTRMDQTKCVLSKDTAELITSPLSSLLPTIPLEPPLFSSLFLSHINLWAGYAQKPTSSGLHCDFHDNLYVLLRGKKTVTLIDSCYHAHLKLHGNVCKRFKNGLLSFVPGMYEDNSTQRERRDARIYEIEKETEEISGKQRSEQNGIEHSKSQIRSIQLQKLEKEMEALLDEALEDADENDFADEDEDNNDVALDDEGDIESGMPERTGNASHAQRCSRRRETDTGPHYPDNFSTLSLEMVPASVPRITVELVAPALLYIPASTFHEVKSSADDTKSEDKDRNGHLALNYWFRPPCEPSFESPYGIAQSLWKCVWERQLQELTVERARLQQLWEIHDGTIHKSCALISLRRRYWVMGTRKRRHSYQLRTL